MLTLLNVAMFLLDIMLIVFRYYRVRLLNNHSQTQSTAKLKAWQAVQSLSSAVLHSLPLPYTQIREVVKKNLSFFGTLSNRLLDKDKGGGSLSPLSISVCISNYKSVGYVLGWFLAVTKLVAQGPLICVLCVCVSLVLCHISLSIILPIQLRSLWNLKLKVLGYQLFISTCRIQVGHP